MHPLLNIAVRAARRAGEIIVRSLVRLESLQVSSKGRNDYVSEVDRSAEREIISFIHKHYPQHAILAEESGASGESDIQWIIDPLDGTTNFLHGIPQFCISIALEREGSVVAGLIYNPVTDEMFIAEKGKGAFLNEQRIRVAARKNLAAAVIACGLPHRGRGQLELGTKEIGAMQPEVAGLRRFGAAALDLAWVAAGRLDGYWERNIKPWDMAAGLILVREAGGFVSDCDGGDDMMAKGHIVAGNEAIQKEVVRVLKQAGRP